MFIASTRSRTAWLRPMELVPHLVHRLVANPAQHQVLVHGGAAVAARVVAHDAGEPAELLRRQVAADHLDLDRGEAALALGLHARGAPALELTALTVWAGVSRRDAGSRGLLVVDEQQRLGIEVTLLDPVALELLVDLALQLLDAELVHEDLQARS